MTTLNFNAINCQDFEEYYDYYPFSGTSLTTVNIGDSVRRIPANFVRGCSGLTTLNFNAINCQDFSSFSSANPFSGTSLTTVNIGDSVQRIPAYFVRNCSGLISVTIGNSVTSIGEWAFFGCSGLTTLNFNAINCQDFEAYYDYAANRYYPFSGTSLTTVNIGDSVQRIPAHFVSECSGLTSVTIGNSVTSIGEFAFYYCNNLTTLNFNAINCQDFESSYYYGNYYYPFSGTSLTTVNIGDSVQRIPANFVENCSGLTSVTIPNSVTSIGRYAFFYCNNLSSITSLAMTPPAISNNAFPYPNICTVTVPCGSLAAYTASTCYWSVYFPQRITESSSFELSVSANEEAYGRVEVENHSCESKTLTAIANEGYEFTAWNDGNTENPRTVSITSDTAFVAIFTEAVSTPTITLTVNNEAMGSASYTMDGNTAVLTATANEGYEFTGWNDGNTENPRTVTVTSDTTFMAIFTETETTPTITVTVNDATMGSASYSLDGNTAVLTATPNEGYEFTAWNDGNTENPRTVTVTSDTAFMAIFTLASSLQEVNAREFALYPNPAKSFVTLEFEALKENTLLQILDINGRRVRTFDLKAGVETLQIDLGDLPKGVYTIMLGNTTKKLIVE